MCDQRWMFHNFISIITGSRPVRGIGVDSKPLQVHGCVDIAIKSLVGGRWHDNTIEAVLFVPGLGANLFSVRSATRRGFNVSFIGDEVKIMCGKKTVTTGTSLSENLYSLNIKHTSVDDFSTLTAMAALTDGRPQPIHTWHKRLGHLAVSTIKKMASENMVDGLNIEKEVDPKFFCEGCAYGKAHRLSFPTGRNRSGRIGELIHSDLCGPMSCTSPSGAKYFIAFKDDYSGYVTIYFLKNKSEAQQCFKYFAKRVEVMTGNRIDTIRSDNGGEFFTTDFATWLKEKGIRQESSAPYTPEQNGVAERLNRTIVESARSMLHSAQVPIYLWAEAVNCAVYLQTRSASK